MSVVYWLGDRLYLNITNRCPNRCYFCIRNFADGVGGFNLRLKREPAVSEVIKALEEVMNRRFWAEVVFCGFGEPTERLDCILEVSRWLKRYFNIQVRLDTNGQGYLLNEGREVLRELKEAGVDKVSVSLNAHNEETYNTVCRPTFKNAYKEVLRFIREAVGLLETEVTAVDVPQVDLAKVEEIAESLGAVFRRRRYYFPAL
ncbi:metallo cofactor biosynthesis protein [Candidatus Bathyarchaeota archaeon]|nr:MAG: metallo cofactor biosynthesis protein [Candidatus Bathyarchaeota archaeon]